MTEKNVIDSLSAIRDELAKFLDSDASNVVQDALAQVNRTKKRLDETRNQTHDPNKPDGWGYKIRKSKPLRFQSVQCQGHTVRTDVFCDLQWGEDGLPTNQEIALRVWSLDESLSFREDWDSQKVLAYLAEVGRADRVVFRCHFDMANTNQPGPENHLQVGGNGELDEQCWFPTSIKIPRFAHPPMDLLLVCQMVAANFFPDLYQGVKESPGWRSRVKESEQLVWKEYYDRCQNYLNDNSKKQTTFLDSFWKN